ncbi:1,4-beta-N-acetylmuramidase [Bifidobacterium ramosum]|nr:GH25 family lysozyme [Bifidobacterium ramosum]KAB8288621.1 1,4-beta-N-acetylmuramidase [Bifidobacterium ramosum]
MASHATKSCRATAVIAAPLLALTLLTPHAVADTATDTTIDTDQPIVNVDQTAMPNPQHMWSGGSEAEAEATDASPYARSAADRKPYWSTSNGKKTFHDGTGRTYLSPAIKVIDVSEHNTSINWAKVAASDVDAVVLRAGYGIDNVDKAFVANLAAVRKYHIPFGVYWYSYAYDATFAYQEGRSLADLLSKYHVTNGELILPAYYDLEDWTWTGYTDKRPSAPAAYEKIVNAFDSAMAKRGYTHTSIYSFTNYLNKQLASHTLWAKTTWVAQYGAQLAFTGNNATASAADKRVFNWQYTSQGTVSGVSGTIDLSAFDARLLPLGGFRDVNVSTPHAQDIVWLSSTGISTGWKGSDGTVTFRGMHGVVRQDMAAFLYRLAGSPAFDASKAKNPFVDVTTKTPHYKEILWLASTGISTGWDTAHGKEFRGGRVVVRQDMAAFLNRLASHMGDTSAAKWQPYGSSMFADVTDKTPHHREVLWLASRGVAQGWTESNGSTTFRGMQTVVRQDMAAFLHRLKDYLGA